MQGLIRQAQRNDRDDCDEWKDWPERPIRNGAINRLHRPSRSPTMYIWIKGSGGMHGGRMHGLIHDGNVG